jgi:acetyltransferase-like isoleucine patch superfamily enzyme/acyl carrier protein
MPISTPPLNYKLEREGTSGISTGPELTILDWSEQHVASGTVGRICVRGEPVFPGYLTPKGTFDRSPFNSNGWFDTGDLGYMDDDGYLYITGRSKEVINRGGELISPFEVENAIVSASMAPESPIHGRVSQALAFSASHDVLQEVVAVVLVTPPGMPRVDLRTLHLALRSYMDDLPKKNNKVLRIKLGQRLGIPEITDDMPYLDRHWDAVCPPPDTVLSVSIPCARCTVDHKSISASLAREVPSDFRSHFWKNSDTNTIEAFIAPATRGTQQPPYLVAELKRALAMNLHNYMVPEQIMMLPNPFVRDSYGNVDEVSLKASVIELEGQSTEKLNASTEGKITKAFAEVLGRSASDIPLDVDFFSLGGDSLRAGKLISMLRAIFNVHLPVSLVFSQGTVAAISKHMEKVAKTTSSDKPNTRIVGCEKTHSSTNPVLMLLQLIPIAIVYPLRRAFQWTVFMAVLAYTQRLPTNEFVVGRLINLTTSIMLSRLVVKCVAPFVGIVAKWLIVGRYQEGLYPMWGLYHTRWWMVEKIVAICGKGFFNLNDTTKTLYCRLMGAKIGKNVKLAGAALGEWDLLDIRDGATLTRCVCRPFAAEGNTSMYLGRIIVRENASIGLSSIIAAGSEIPANTCIGPNSSSWELQDADEANRDLSPTKGPKPHWLLELLFTNPLALVAWFLSLLPWFGGLIGMVLRQAVQYSSPIRGILNWFTAADRIAYHYLALILRTFFSPFILFAFAILVKMSLDIFFGKLGPSRASARGAIPTWRASLIRTLLPASRLHNVTGLFGQHYEATSIALRMLGSKIGMRVYWPGTGPGIGDYHLLDVGNDVVFGSRAHLITSDGTGSETVTIRDRAMIADRVCLLPGVEVGERATMGSGALTKRGTSYPADSTYVGSKGGDAVCLSTGRQQPLRARIHHMSSDDTLAAGRNVVSKKTPRSQIQHMSSDDTLAESRKSSKTREKEYQATMDSFSSDSETDDKGDEQFSTDDLSPFGRAFYLKLAPYHVLGPFAIFCYSSFITVFTTFYWNVPSISSIQLVDLLMNRFVPLTVNFWMDVLWLLLMSWGTIAILNTLQALMALCIVVAAKWILIGRRNPGNYDWDKSAYCQRWQIFLCVEKLRRQCYRGHGVLGLLTGTSWIVLYFRALGAKIGKDCALFANGRPSLMFTEPDLITLGDRVAVDDASVVAHINTRGKFDLNRLEVGDRCVLAAFWNTR